MASLFARLLLSIDESFSMPCLGQTGGPVLNQSNDIITQVTSLKAVAKFLDKDFLRKNLIEKYGPSPEGNEKEFISA